MKISSFSVGPFAENTYLLTAGAEALVVDPGFFEPHEFEAFEQTLSDEQATLQAVLLTHAHIDHIIGLKRVLERYDVPVYLSDKDRYLWEHYPSQAQRFGFKVEGYDFSPLVLPEQKGWTLGAFTFDLIYTPGHAPDHMALYHSGSETLIAGDTLFKEGIGRSDLYKGDMQVLKSSIKKLYQLPDATTIYPGHGPSSTIGYEKKNNPFVKAD